MSSRHDRAHRREERMLPRRRTGISRVALLCLLVVVLSGCRQQMATQPYYRPLDPSEFFANGTSARTPVAGTVPRGELRLDTAFYRGIEKAAASQPRAGGGVREPDGVESTGQPVAPAAVTPGAEVALTVARDDLEQKPYVREFPIVVNRDVAARGQTLFTAFCAPCHGATGAGNGVVVQRGFTAPPTIHSERLRRAPPGYFFDVISRGYGSMPDYSAQVQPGDRWAIVAYLRALQLFEPPAETRAPQASEASRVP